MAVICRDLKLLFIMTPRTACSAVGLMLREELGGEWFPPAPMRDAKGAIDVRQKHATLDELLDADLLTDEDRDRMLVFAGVRNPFERLNRCKNMVKRDCRASSWRQASPS